MVVSLMVVSSMVVASGNGTLAVASNCCIVCSGHVFLQELVLSGLRGDFSQGERGIVVRYLLTFLWLRRVLWLTATIWIDSGLIAPNWVPFLGFDALFGQLVSKQILSSSESLVLGWGNHLFFNIRWPIVLRLTLSTRVSIVFLLLLCLTTSLISHLLNLLLIVESVCHVECNFVVLSRSRVVGLLLAFVQGSHLI